MCLSKALLDNVCSDKNAREVYRDYFLPLILCDDNTNLSSIKQRPKVEEKLRNSMFKIREPNSKPAFFDFDSYHDVNRLCKVLNIEIVIYYSDSGSSFSFLEIFHDFRTSTSAKKTPEKTVYFVVTSKMELYKFYHSLDACLDTSKYFFAQSQEKEKFSPNQSIASCIARLLRLNQPPENLNDNGDVASFMVNSSGLFEHWNEQVLVVSFSRSLFLQCSDFKRRGYRRRDPRKMYFSTIALIGSSSDASSVVDVKKVVCLYSANSVCELSQKYASNVLARFHATNNKDRLDDAGYQGIPSVSAAERQEAEELFRAKKKKPPTKADLKEKKCKCSICKCKDFDRNMSVAGPERLCTTELDICEILQMLGADSPEHLAIVDRMCELSVAAMDIESMTLRVDLDKPEDVLMYKSIDSASLEGHILKIQKPCMIAHIDSLSEDEVSSDNVIVTSEGDDEESLHAMMKKYWKVVLKRKKAANTLKKKLAVPLFNLVQQYCDKHIAFCHDWSANKFQLDTSDYAKAWKQSLPGKLQIRLYRLIYDYNIFTFYG